MLYEVITVRMDNTLAIRLYERLGFEDHRILPGYYEDGLSGPLRHRVGDDLLGKHHEAEHVHEVGAPRIVAAEADVGIEPPGTAESRLCRRCPGLQATARASPGSLGRAYGPQGFRLV